MRYKIHTTPIWDAFKQKNACPLCTIRNNISERLVKQYLNEAVMEPIYREKANKSGFCHEHIRIMQNGDNKLGVSLQLATRSDHIGGLMSIPDKKNCKKEADRILEAIGGCVICENTAWQLSQYFETIAMMYQGEKEFPALLGACGGFCMEHYAGLVKHAHSAGNTCNEYLSILYRIQKGLLRTVKYNLDCFADMFDHQRGASVTPEAKDAVNKAIQYVIKQPADNSKGK